MTRKPTHYRLWLALGRRARIERILLWLGGPFSNTPPSLGRGRNSYDVHTHNSFDRLVCGEGAQGDHIYIVQDRSDARILIPLASMHDHTVILEFAADGIEVRGGRINVFANGRYLATVNREELVGAGRWQFFIPGDVLFGRWVELSLRAEPHDAKGSDRPRHDLIDLPVQRLQVLTSAPEASLAGYAPAASNKGSAAPVHEG